MTINTYSTISLDDLGNDVPMPVIGHFVGVYRGVEPMSSTPKLVMSMVCHAQPDDAVADAKKQCHFTVPGGEVVPYLISATETTHSYSPATT